MSINTPSIDTSPTKPVFFTNPPGMTAEKAKQLREPFPKSAIGKLPKGGTTLDYVGHAAVSDRLLQVDPGWKWLPLALDDAGLPALDSEGNLWIKLTVCGVTRLGVGDGATMKIRIGDAIRNAAMRFGVALDLWAKEDLHPGEEGAGKPLATKAAPATRGPVKKEKTGGGGLTDADTEHHDRRCRAMVDALKDQLSKLEPPPNHDDLIEKNKNDLGWLTRQFESATENVKLQKEQKDSPFKQPAPKEAA